MSAEQKQEAVVKPSEIPAGFTLISDRHFNALAEGLAEVLSTHTGRSDQPIGDILEYVMDEIEASPSPIQGFVAPAASSQERIARLEAQVAEAVKVIEPFAVMGKLVHPNALDKDNAHDWHIDPTVGQLRSASAFLAAAPERIVGAAK